MRMKTIDSCLRRRQRLWTLEDLREACEEALYDYEGICGISIRTIQRDIEVMRGSKLGYFAPIVVRERKYYTYSDPDYSITQLPLSKHDIAELSSAMDIIKHYNGFRGMAGSEDILARMQDQIRSQESHRQVVFIDTNNRLKGLHFLGRLYDHIIKKEPIVVEYQSFKAAHPSQIFFSPYLLKEFNNRWFLIGYGKKMKTIQNIALDRMIDVYKDESEKAKFVENTFFKPQKYFSEMVGVTRGLENEPELVTIWIDADQAPYVITKPMHESQQVTKQYDDGSIEITVNIIQNFEFERLILGYGSHVEVIAPRKIRHRIAQSILLSATRYQK